MKDKHKPIILRHMNFVVLLVTVLSLITLIWLSARMFLTSKDPQPLVGAILLIISLVGIIFFSIRPKQAMTISGKTFQVVESINWFGTYIPGKVPRGTRLNLDTVAKVTVIRSYAGLGILQIWFRKPKVKISIPVGHIGFGGVVQQVKKNVPNSLIRGKAKLVLDKPIVGSLIVSWPQAILIIFLVLAVFVFGVCGASL